MYGNGRSQVRVSNTSSDVLNVQVGVHQDFSLGPLLFIVALEAFSNGLRTCCPWESVHADDLVLLARTMNGLLSKHGNSKQHLETKGLRVNMGKTKV